MFWKTFDHAKTSFPKKDKIYEIAFAKLFLQLLAFKKKEMQNATGRSWLCKETGPKMKP